MSTASKTPLLVATVIAALGLVVAAAALASACTARSTINELDPANGKPGATTTVHGRHFVEGEVDIYWDSVASSNLLATVGLDETYGTEDGRGFSKTVTIPGNARVGDHHIVARSAEDSGGNQYIATAVFEVTRPQESNEEDPSGGGSQDTSGEPSQDTSGSPQNTSGESSQESGSPSEEPSSEPSQNTQSSQTTSGPTSQETSAAGSREEGGDTAGTSTMPGLGSGDDQARSEPTNESRREPTPDQSQSPDQAGSQEPAQNRESVGGGPQPAPQNQPATDGRDQVGAETPAQPTPAPQPSAPDDGQTVGAEPAEPAPAPTTDQSATSESEEQVFEGSVGPSESTDGESGRAEDPLADGEAQQTDPQAAESEAHAEDTRPSGQDADTPSESSAGADLWSGLESGETPSLTPSPGEAADSDPRGGMAGALMAGVALLGLGMAGLLVTAGAVAVRRRRLATATRAQR